MDALTNLNGQAEAPKAEALKPAVSIRKSVTPDYLICLEDGKKLKMLKRHLRTTYDMSPQDYREKWGLPADYPMVAPNYSAARRSEFAKQIGLGRKAAAEQPRRGSAPRRKRKPGGRAPDHLSPGPLDQRAALARSLPIKGVQNMIEADRIKYLRIALLIVGLVFIFGLWPLTILMAVRLVWHAGGRSEYLEMILGIYATLGVFLIMASRDPMAHRSLIWFTFWSKSYAWCDHGGSVDRRSPAPLGIFGEMFWR